MLCCGVLSAATRCVTMCDTSSWRMNVRAHGQASSSEHFSCAGPKGEGGLDDASGGSGGSGGGASLKQTSATVDLGMPQRAVQTCVIVVGVRVRAYADSDAHTLCMACRQVRSWRRRHGVGDGSQVPLAEGQVVGSQDIGQISA